MVNCSSISHLKMNGNERKYFGGEDVEHGFIQVLENLYYGSMYTCTYFFKTIQYLNELLHVLIFNYYLQLLSQLFSSTSLTAIAYLTRICGAEVHINNKPWFLIHELLESHSDCNN